MRLLPLAAVLSACGVPESTPLPSPELRALQPALRTEVALPLPLEEPAPVTLALKLETRDGVSAEGWRLAPVELVSQQAAELTLHAWDCGARGRWVDIRSNGDVEFCVRRNAASVREVDGAEDGCNWFSSFEAGGSHADLVGVGVLVRRGSERLGRLRIARHSVLAERWYEQQPIAPFEVELEFLASPR